MAGSSIAFLKYNFPPAKIFLGDAGSLMIGFLLAAIGLGLDLVGPNAVVRAVIPALALAVPLFDLVLVVTARIQGRRPIYLGGTDHTAHRLAAAGVRHRWIAISAYATQAICSILAFGLYEASGGTILATSVAVASVALTAWVLLLRMEPPSAAADGARVAAGIGGVRE